MDARLAALADAIEAGAKSFTINLAVGQWIITGTPVSGAEFVARSQNNLGSLIVDQLTWRDRRQVQHGQADYLWQQIMQQTAEMIAPIMDGTGAAGGALSLVDVTMTGGMAGVLRVVAQRVPLHAVDAWWICNFQHEPAKFSGGGVSAAF